MKNFRTVYSNLVQTKNFEAHHMVQLAILRAMDVPNADEADVLKHISWQLQRSFTPITSKTKLDNGAAQNGARERAIRTCTWCMPFQYEEYLSKPEIVRYKRLVNCLAEDLKDAAKSLAKRHYVYIFVRQDLDSEYQLVQASHAAAKMGHRLGAGGIAEEAFDNLYFAVIGVPNLAGLATAIGDLHSLGVPHHAFIEPDIGNQMTAIASEPILANERKRLLSYKKLKFTHEIKFVIEAWGAGGSGGHI